MPSTRIRAGTEPRRRLQILVSERRRVCCAANAIGRRLLVADDKRYLLPRP